MTVNGSDLVLDGNAAAGLLQEIFVLEITTAQIQCEACGSTTAVGSLRLYAAPMGAVLSCIRCDGILMRAVHTPHGRWLEHSVLSSSPAGPRHREPVKYLMIGRKNHESGDS